MTRRTEIIGYAIAGAWLLLAALEGVLANWIYVLTYTVLAGFVSVLTRANANFARANQELTAANDELLKLLETQQRLIRGSTIAAITAEYVRSKN